MTKFVENRTDEKDLSKNKIKKQMKKIFPNHKNK
jgi:hypothetical protein